MKKIIAIALAALMVLSLAGCGEKKSTKTNLELVATLDQAILSLAAGKCDAVALDGTTAQRYVDQSEGAFAMSGINFDLEMYGIHEGNVAAAKKGEESLINAINECIKVICGTPSGKVKEGYTDTYYTWWVANCRVQAGTDNEAAIDIVGDYNMFEGVTPDENYDYLRSHENHEIRWNLRRLRPKDEGCGRSHHPGKRKCRGPVGDVRYDKCAAGNCLLL